VGKRKRGSLGKRWEDCLKEDMAELKESGTYDRSFDPHRGGAEVR